MLTAREGTGFGGGLGVDGDRQGWMQGVRLMLVAVVCAVLTATLVIRAGSLILNGQRGDPAPRAISPASW